MRPKVENPLYRSNSIGLKNSGFMNWNIFYYKLARKINIHIKTKIIQKTIQVAYRIGSYSGKIENVYGLLSRKNHAL